MKMKKILILFILALISSCAQNKTKGEVKIGNQIWSDTNLDVEKFNNGDIIPEAKTNEEWNLASKNKTSAWCYYDNDRNNGLKYGKLYNWYAITDPRGIAPKGWHIPKEEEWIKLSSYLGGDSIAGDKMKSTSGWDVSGEGNNESEFNGLPGGFRFDYGDFANITGLGNFWSTTESPISNVEVLILDYGTSTTSFTPFGKGFGMSVRCIKD
jgi:uncharacterized protein (TIGR02145 family)